MGEVGVVVGALVQVWGFWCECGGFATSGWMGFGAGAWGLVQVVGWCRYGGLSAGGWGLVQVVGWCRCGGLSAGGWGLVLVSEGSENVSCQ